MERELYESTLTMHFTDVASPTSGYHFGSFLQHAFQSCQGRLTYRNQEPPISESQICQKRH